MRNKIAGLLLGLILGTIGFAWAQSKILSRTTSSAGGPSGQGYIGDYDTGMVTLPNSATTVTAGSVLVTSIYCHNITAGAVTVTITDNSGVIYIPTISIPGAGVSGSVVQFVNAGQKGIIMAGIKWNASAAASINCQISGYN